MAPRRLGPVGAIPDKVDPLRGYTHQGELYAALDLGTNSCRMLIARANGRRLQIVDSFSKAVQLGAGLDGSGALSRVSMRRTVQALRVCRRKLDQHRVKRMRLVATEACRRARNGREFLEQVRNVGERYRRAMRAS